MDNKFFSKVIKDMEKDNKKDIEYKSALFQHEVDFFVLYKRIQNLSSAVFLVMDSVSDNPGNTLKSSICQETLDCLFELSGSIAGNEPMFEGLRRLGASLLNVNALLEITFWTKLISKNNFEILRAEIEKIYSLTTDLLSRYASRFALEGSFFERNIEKIPEPEKDYSEGHLYKGQKDKRTSPLEKRHEEPSQEKITRRRLILDLLRQKSNLSIKDISSVVAGYGEKTIQRELASLVLEGLIVREGKRRWSTYSLPK